MSSNDAAGFLAWLRPLVMVDHERLMGKAQAALAAEYQRGRRAALEEGADALEKEAAFLESRIGHAREASTMRDAENLLRVLAQPEPTPDDGVSPI